MRLSRRLGVCLMAWLLAAGCTLDPTKYEDPPPEDAASGADVAADVSFTFDAGTGGPANDAAGSDAAGSDAAGSDDTTSDDVPTADAGASTCGCRFLYPATSPLPQSYVRLTGDFVATPWTTEVALGALEMDYDASADIWSATVLLEDGQSVAYKYVMGWPDNGGPVWANQDGNMDGGAPDSTLNVVCGAAPCDG